MTGSDHETAVESTSVFSSGLIGRAEEPTEQTLTGLEALAVGQALLVVKRGPNAGSRFQLDKDLVTAGRHPESDIFLDDVTVSRRHAEFRRVGRRLRGLRRRLAERHLRQPGADRAAGTLANGDEVQIGKFRLVFLTGAHAGRPRGSHDGSRPADRARR